MKIRLLVASVLLLLFSCESRKVDTAGVKEEMNRYKIKRITPGEIMGQAEQTGQEIVDSIQRSIDRNLDSALKAGGIKGAVGFCVLKTNPVLKELEKKYTAGIRRAGFQGRLRNPSNAPDSLQAMILDGYQYNIEKGLEPVKNVSLEDKEIIFSAPVFLSNNTCLRCHGTPGKDIPEEEYKTIMQRYPQDKSTGFKLNDPMGVWTVRFGKEEFIGNMK